MTLEQWLRPTSERWIEVRRVGDPEDEDKSVYRVSLYLDSTQEVAEYNGLGPTIEEAFKWAYTDMLEYVS
jgi:hypothetical protein